MSENCTHNCSTCGENCSERKAPQSFQAPANEFSNVKKVIAVVSGKGGVGKSMVTSLLSVLSQRKGNETAILDADITGPSIPKTFQVSEKAESSEAAIYPVKTDTGIKLMSINLLLDDATMPVIWRGPIVAGTVKQFWSDVLWEDVDLMFVDCPPGTGDVPLTVFQSLPIDGIIVVTSPQDLVSMIVGKAVKMAEMMNIPILYWASKEIGDTRFAKVAMRHADMSMRDHVRADGSVNHIVMHDTNKPNTVLGVRAGQGYSETSCWSRGASWALYGFTLSYIHTKEDRYLQTAKKVAEYFIKETEKTAWLPRLDFRQPEEPLYYDSTAGAIASCGLIELAKNVDNESEKEKYLSVALHILKAMEKSWCNWSENEDSILQMGSLMYEKEQHMPIIYGDYFFAEAVLKLKGTDFLAW